MSVHWVSVVCTVMFTLKQTKRENGSVTITMAQEKAVRSQPQMPMPSSLSWAMRKKKKEITMAQEKVVRSLQLFFFLVAQDNNVGIGICGWPLTAFSWAIVIVTLPFSLCVCFKVNVTACLACTCTCCRNSKLRIHSKLDRNQSKLWVYIGCP